MVSLSGGSVWVRASLMTTAGKLGGGAIGAARRAVEGRAGPPTGGVGPGVERGVLVTNDEREALAVGGRIPGVVIGEVEDGFLEGALEVEALAAVVESAGVLAGDVRDRRIAGEEGGGIGDEHHVLAGAEVGDGVGGGEGEADAVGEADPDEVERLARRRSSAR